MITLDDSVKLSDYKVLRNPAIHDQSIMKILTGKADFAADHFAGHKFFGAIKFATIAHGEVTSVDVSEALKLPGVKAVITADDCPVWNKTITWYGQEVAGVVADNWYTALRALPLIKVAYKEAAASVDPDYAMQEGAPLTGILPNSNIGTAGVCFRDAKSDKRSTAAANNVFDPSTFNECDVVKEYTFGWTTTYPHNELEAHQTTAWWVGDDLYYYTGCQDITSNKATVANALGMALNKVHAVTHFNCGGFGGKTSDILAPAAAVMSKKIGGYPVLCKNTRQLNSLNRGHNFPTRSRIKFGVKKDGKNYKFHACDAEFWSDGGVNSFSPVGNVFFGLQKTYIIPNISLVAYRIQTNTPTRGYWRCVNDPCGAMNYDSAIDKLAYDLGIDPYDLRMNNLGSQALPDQDVPTMYWGSFPIKEELELAAQKSDYKKKFKLTPKSQKVDDIYHNGDMRWYGISITGHEDSHGSSSGSGRGGIIKAQTDGTFLVNTGSARGCSGGTTVCCNVAAETLGAKPEDVKLGEWGNTDVGLNAGIQAGSSHTISISSAYYNAALEMRYKIFQVALTKAPFKGVATSVDDLYAEDSVVYLKKDKSVSATFKALNWGNNIAASGQGWTVGAAGTVDEIGRRNGGAWRSVGNYIKPGQAVYTYGSAAAATEVAVDEETGEVEILHIWNIVDTGCTMFKNGTLKEIGCGAEAFHNQAFFYNTVYDPNTGAVISTNYTEAMFPTYMDMKTENHDLIDYESMDAGGPFGCHGIAEPCVTNYSSVLCAIYNAVGVWVDPQMAQMSADRVLKALGKA